MYGPRPKEPWVRCGKGIFRRSVCNIIARDYDSEIIDNVNGPRESRTHHLRIALAGAIYGVGGRAVVRGGRASRAGRPVTRPPRHRSAISSRPALPPAAAAMPSARSDQLRPRSTVPKQNNCGARFVVF